MKNSILNRNLSTEEEKLEHFQKKKVLSHLIEFLSQEDDSTYYLPTNQIAGIIEEMIKNKEALSHTQWELVKDLSLDDIHVLISHKE